jgi:hypothetical protein
MSESLQHSLRFRRLRWPKLAQSLSSSHESHPDVSHGRKYTRRTTLHPHKTSFPTVWITQASGTWSTQYLLAWPCFATVAPSDQDENQMSHFLSTTFHSGSQTEFRHSGRVGKSAREPRSKYPRLGTTRRNVRNRRGEQNGGSTSESGRRKGITERSIRALGKQELRENKPSAGSTMCNHEAKHGGYLHNRRAERVTTCSTKYSAPQQQRF